MAIKKKIKAQVCLIVTSKVKKLIRDEGLRCGKDFVEALSAHVRAIVDAGISNTKDGGRKQTLGAEDVPDLAQ